MRCHQSGPVTLNKKNLFLPFSAPQLLSMEAYFKKNNCPYSVKILKVIFFRLKKKNQDNKLKI